MRNARKYVDVVGMKSERLTVIREIESIGKIRRALCACSCGTQKQASLLSLVSGRTKSCGCLQREIRASAGSNLTTHGLSGTRTHRIWKNMKTRCENPNRKAWAWYGAIGIKVCDRWSKSYTAFLEDMGEAPEGLTLDRIDSSANYEPGNCRWSTRHEQSRNTKANINITYGGKTMCLRDWSTALNVPYSRLKSRHYAGWEVERMFNEPAQKHQRKGASQ